MIRPVYLKPHIGFYRTQKSGQNGHMFVIQLLLGAVMILITVVMHVSLYETLYQLLQRHTHTMLHLFRRAWRMASLAGIVLAVFVCHVASIWLWAGLFLILDIPVLSTLPDTLYFTTVTYTTLGYGDIILDHHWRLLASFSAANGLILFGWSTAFLYEVISKLHRGDQFRP